MSEVDSLVMLREFGFSLGKCLCILLVGSERHVGSEEKCIQDFGAKLNVIHPIEDLRVQVGINVI